MKWIRKAAEQDITAAQLYIGICYQNGDGVDKDIYEATKWYRMAAEKGMAEAQYRLGLLYVGYGTQKDKIEAIEWLMKASVQGHEEASDFLKEILQRSQR